MQERQPRFSFPATSAVDAPHEGHFGARNSPVAGTYVRGRSYSLAPRRTMQGTRYDGTLRTWSLKGRVSIVGVSSSVTSARRRDHSAFVASAWVASSSARRSTARARRSLSEANTRP